MGLQFSVVPKTPTGAWAIEYAVGRGLLQDPSGAAAFAQKVYLACTSAADSASVPAAGGPAPLAGGAAAGASSAEALTDAGKLSGY